MATLPTDPKPGDRFRLEPDDGTEIGFEPDGPGDDVPRKVTRPGGRSYEWYTAAEAEALPGGPLVPQPGDRVTLTLTGTVTHLDTSLAVSVDQLDGLRYLLSRFDYEIQPAGPDGAEHT